METLLSLRNHLLIATPAVQEVGFEHAVIYICEHQPQGTVGLIINRPMVHSLGLVFQQLHLEPIRVELNHRPLLFGGPEQTDRGFVMHRPFGHWHSSLMLDTDVTITTSNDIIRALAHDTGPKDALVALGFVGWDSVQLKSEMQKNHWLVCPARPELLFDVPFEQRWSEAALSIGVKVSQLVEGSGHA